MYLLNDASLSNVRVESNAATSASAARGQGGGLFVVAGKLLMTAGTVLVGNTASGTGAQYIALGGVATYLLPAPPGSWIAGLRCIVYRGACPRDEKGNVEDPQCEVTTPACQYETTSDAVVDGTQCQPLLSNQPCDWCVLVPRTTPCLLSQSPTDAHCRDRCC